MSNSTAPVWRQLEHELATKTQQFMEGALNEVTRQALMAMLSPHAWQGVRDLGIDEPIAPADLARAADQAMPHVPAKLRALWAEEAARAQGTGPNSTNANLPATASTASDDAVRTGGDQRNLALTGQATEPVAIALPAVSRGSTTLAVQADAMQVSDQHLIEVTQTAARPAADRAFETLLMRHDARLRAQVRHSASSVPSMMEDVIQEARWRAWCRLRRSNPLVLGAHTTFEHYLMAIARNVVRDYARTVIDQRRFQLSLEVMQQDDPSWDPALPGPPEEIREEEANILQMQVLSTLFSREREAPSDVRSTVLAHLAELAARSALNHRSTAYEVFSHIRGPCRDAFILHMILGLRVRDIAEQLHLSTRTVANHIAQGRKQYAAVYALLLWEDDGATEKGIADTLRVAIRDVAGLLDIGRKLRALGQRHIAQSHVDASDT